MLHFIAANSFSQENKFNYYNIQNPKNTLTYFTAFTLINLNNNNNNPIQTSTNLFEDKISTSEFYFSDEVRVHLNKMQFKSRSNIVQTRMILQKNLQKSLQPRYTLTLHRDPACSPL